MTIELSELEKAPQSGGPTVNCGTPERAVHAEQMLENAQHTTEFLKSLAHAARLVILCRLAQGPATVTQLEEMLNMRQASVSQQLARLRREGLVEPTRDGRTIYYSLADERARKVVGLLYELFCDCD